MMTSFQPDIFEWALAQPAADDPGLVHLIWSAPTQGDRVVRVLIDGALYAVSTDPIERAVWLLLDPTLPHRITLQAVDDDENAWAWDRPTTAIVRDLSLPIGTQVRLTAEDGRQWTAPLFGVGTDRPGFGAVFGVGGFGHDLSVGPGLGRGALGLGPLGAGGDALRLRGEQLGAGSHELAASLISPGSIDSPATTLTLDNPVITPPPLQLQADAAGTLTWS